MKTINIAEAKAQLSELIDRAAKGEDVTIARRGEALVRLVPVIKPVIGRRFGALKGRAGTSEAFFEPLGEEELTTWAQ